MPRLDILEREQEIRQWIDEGQTKAYIAKQLKCKPETLNSYLKKLGINYSGRPGIHTNPNYNTGYQKALYYIDNNLPIKSDRLKQKLIRDGLKPRRCEICGVSEWRGVKLPLELHHKNNNHYDNSLDNLQILCPNCHSIQEGNSGANIGKYHQRE